MTRSLLLVPFLPFLPFLLVATACGDTDSADDVVCTGASAAPPAMPVEYRTMAEAGVSMDDLMSVTVSGSYAFDPGACPSEQWFTALPLGSAFARVSGAEDRSCEIWLGGETENPMYDGSITQYCRFPAGCTPVTVTLGDGGPARIDSPYCVAAGG
ncbi:MAG: hypothetical protein DRJ42_19165 [Deltaproteobacteria bacterium]|nr:MAG: hypothetical protein DRJ42_19165 [Deltaproteobacteria bacterium]